MLPPEETPSRCLLVFPDMPVLAGAQAGTVSFAISNYSWGISSYCGSGGGTTKKGIDSIALQLNAGVYAPWLFHLCAVGYRLEQIQILLRPSVELPWGYRLIIEQAWVSSYSQSYGMDYGMPQDSIVIDYKRITMQSLSEDTSADDQPGMEAQHGFLSPTILPSLPKPTSDGGIQDGKGDPHGDGK